MHNDECANRCDLRHSALQVRWFVDLFSESFMPGLFGMLRADSDESLQAAQTKFETALKVTLLSLLVTLAT